MTAKLHVVEGLGLVCEVRLVDPGWVAGRMGWDAGLMFDFDA